MRGRGRCRGSFRRFFLIRRRFWSCTRHFDAPSTRASLNGALLVLTIASATTLLVSAQTRPAAPAVQTSPQPATIRYVPDDVQEEGWLQRLKSEQIKAMSGVAAFHDFQFTDRVAASGITFKHHIVDDA